MQRVCRQQPGLIPSSRGSAQVLVVDDEPEVCASLRRGLEPAGFSVSEAHSVSSLKRQFETDQGISLLTLDLNLGSDDGLKLIHSLRSSRNIPIIAVTARATPYDRALGLEEGTDDYITKPFLISEVLLRIRNVLRRYELETSQWMRSSCDPEEIKTSVGTVNFRKRIAQKPNGDIFDLTDAEFDILALFVRHPDRILSRDDIMMIWKGRHWMPTDRIWMDILLGCERKSNRIRTRHVFFELFGALDMFI